MFNTRLILTLLNIKGIGRAIVNNLIKYKLPDDLDEISILNFLQESKYKVKRLPKVPIEDIIAAKNKCENIILKCKEENIKIITILDKEFPLRLKIINQNPVLIYYKGHLSCLNKNKSIALIGTRVPTSHGQKVSYKLGKILSQKGFVVISGLALGCDTFAHRGCLDAKGNTIAVMPCGLNIVYPYQNKELYKKIIDNGGCIISEYAPNQNVSKNQFVERDRLQSALSCGVIVVESTINSGTMHTVNFAINQNKIIGCYKPSEKYNKEKSVEGNLYLLKNKSIHPISNLELLNKFILKLEEELAYEDFMFIEESTQLKFII